jgi:predicted RND superfamily exporter protein
MTRNEGHIDRLARGVVAVGALMLAMALGIGSVAGVILVLVAIVMGVTAAVGFCPLYRLIGLSTERDTVAPH